MAECASCGKRGLFLHLNSVGLCRQCEKAAERREQEQCQENLRIEQERKEVELPQAAQYPNNPPSPQPENHVHITPRCVTAKVDLQRIYERGQELDYVYYDPDEEDIDISSTPTIVTAEPLGNIGELHEYVVLDFETTGLSYAQDKIIEIGAMKVSGGVKIDSMSTFVNPRIPIPDAITQLTGISDDSVVNAPDIIDAISTLHEFIGGLPLVAHNASFDIGFLCAAYEKANISESINYIDTLQLARKAFPNAPNHKLSTLVEYLSLGGVQEHRAISDVYLTNALFLECLQHIDKIENRFEKVCPLPSLTSSQLIIAEWAKKVLTDANRDTSLLAFEPMSKYFRISCFHQVMDIKLGRKLQYALIENRYIGLISKEKLVPCAKSEGPSCDGFQSMRFPITDSASLDDLVPVLLAAFDHTLLRYQSAKKYLTQRDIKTYFTRAIQI